MLAQTPDENQSAEAPANRTNHTHLLIDDGGQPIALIDMERITDDGTKLAFELAAHCDDPIALDRLSVDWVSRYLDPSEFGYVAAAALRVVVEHILSPSFDVAEAYGTDLRAGMRAIAEGRDPR